MFRSVIGNHNRKYIIPIIMIIEITVTLKYDVITKKIAVTRSLKLVQGASALSSILSLYVVEVDGKRSTKMHDYIILFVNLQKSNWVQVSFYTSR